MPSGNRPPRGAVRLMERVLRSRVQRHGVIGDLTEEYVRRRRIGTRFSADFWFYRQALSVHWRFRSEARRADSRLRDSTRGPGESSKALEDLADDLGFFSRGFVKRPLFGLSTVFTLALGIGACTAVFSLVSGILLHPLPYAEPDRLVAVVEGQAGRTNASFTYPLFEYWKESQDVFESLEAHGFTRRILNYGGAAERLRGEVVSAGLFSTLGIRPFLGRGFRPDEDEPGAEAVIVLSHEFWATRLHADPNALGRSITVDEKPFTVIGVMPADFFFPDPTVHFWIPLADAIRNPNTWYLRLVGRLPEGVQPETARARAATLERVSGDGEQESEPASLGFSSLKDEVVGSDIQRLLLILAAAVGGVLLIACSNVASLLLSRTVSRRAEITLRAALGASRGRLIRQLVTEATALGLLGAGTGIGVAVLLTKGLFWLSPSLFPRQEEIGIDLGVLVFSLGLALVVGLLVGVAPALKSSRPNLVEGMGDGPRGITSRGGEGRARDLLVAAQVAMAFTLIVGAGLLTNSFVRQWTNPSGFSNTDRVLAVNLTLPGAGSDEWTSRFASHSLRLDFYNSLMDRLKADPSIRSATLASRFPFSGGGSQGGIRIQGAPTEEGGRNLTGITVIAPEYFATMGVRLLRGREFDARDADIDNPAIIVDQTMVDRYFQGLDPLGQLVQFGDDDPWLSVVGVVEPTRQVGLTEAHTPQAYLNFAESEWFWSHHGMVMLVGTTSSPLSAAPVVRSTLAKLDPGVPISSLTSMESRILASVGEARFLGLLVSFFGLVALTLALVGVYALTSHAVTQRTREIGIRLALGAKPREIIRETVLRSLYLTGLGLATGALASYWAAGWLQSLLFGISPRDLPTFGASLILLSASAVLASLIPAVRATRMDPVRALGED